MCGCDFQPSEALKAMVYFEDGDLPRRSRYDQETLIKAVIEVRDLPSVAIASRTLSMEA